MLLVGVVSKRVVEQSRLRMIGECFLNIHCQLKYSIALLLVYFHLPESSLVDR